MNKKKYQKPDMTVYQLNRTSLLAGSPTGGSGEPGVYIPRINEDLNKLA